MKNLILLTMMLLFSIASFAQGVSGKLENKDNNSLNAYEKDNTIIYTKVDTSGGYRIRNLDYRKLESELNILRTPYGNVAGVDSVVSLNGVGLYADSTVVNNYLRTSRIKEGLFNTNQTTMSGGFNFVNTPNNTNEEILSNEWNSNCYINFASRPQLGFNNWGADGTFQNESGLDFNSIRGQNKANPLPSHQGDRLGRITWGFRAVSGANVNPVAIYATVTDTVAGRGSLNINLNSIDDNAEVSFYLDSTVVNNTLIANKGIKIAQLSYIPSSSTDLQSEASTAEVGTMWLKDISGSMYLITKISSTKIARVAFAEW